MICLITHETVVYSSRKDSSFKSWYTKSEI